MQCLDRAFLADGSGEEDERHVWSYLPRGAQCRQAVEAWQREIRQDEIRREVIQGGHQRLLGFDAPPVAGDTGARELVQGAFGVCLEILHEEDTDGFSGRLSHMWANVSRWHDPELRISQLRLPIAAKSYKNWCEPSGFVAAPSC